MVFFEGNYPFYGVFCRCSLHYEKFQDGTVKCIEEEVPFDIPDSWVWVRLGALAQYKKGPFGSSMTKSMFVPDSPSAIKVYEQKNAINKDVSLGSYFVSEEKYETLKGFEIFPNDIIVSCAGTIGETYVMPETMRKGIINQALMKISLYDLRIIDFYLIYFDCQLKNAAREQGHGVALKNIPPFDVLKKYLVPIPPIQEQARIVDSVNDLLGIINSIDTYKDELHASVTSIKSKILDLAIRGKLVPQNPNDEPASVLLERIHAEKEELIKQGKIKRDKKESIIFKGDDNSYYEKIDGISKKIDAKTLFDIPENWHWERLGNISTIARGGSPRPIDDYLTTDENGINWIKIGDAEQGEKYIYRTKEKIKPDGLSKTRYVKSGDFLLTNSMSFGRPYILKTDGCIHDGWLVIGDIKNVFDQDFLYYALSSDFMYNSFAELAAGSTVKNLKSDTVRSVLFPVPPRQEQKRISQHLENLFYVLAKIEQRLS